MTTAMKASFTLTLKDELSSGLNDLQKNLNKLRDTGKELSLGKLERADNVLPTLSREVRNLTSDMQRVEGVADRTWGALKRMASVRFESMKSWGQRMVGAGSRIGGNLGIMGGAAAGISLIEPVRKYAGYADTLTHIGITKGLSGVALRDEVGSLGMKFNAEALETGQSSQSIADAYSQLIRKGISPRLVDESIRAHSLAATAYNTTAEAFTGSTAAMLQNFQVRPDQLPQALSALGQASKEGDFKVTDFSMYLPGVGAQFARNGITGLGGANLAMAALQTTMKDVHEPGQAQTDLIQGMRYIYSGAGARAFGMENMRKGSYTADVHKLMSRALGNGYSGININKMLQGAEKNGVNPIFALLPKLESMTKGFDFSERSELFGALFHSVDAGNFWGALVGHADFFQTLLAKLNNTDPGQLNRDAVSAMSSPKVTLDKADEGIEQIWRRIGEGFEPVVKKLEGGLESVIGGLNALDRAIPGLTNTILKAGGGGLAGVAAVAGLGIVAPWVTGGASILWGAGAAGAGVLGMPSAVPLFMLGAGGAAGAMQAPMVDDYGRVVGNWGGRDESHNPDYGGLQPGSLAPPQSFEFTIHADPGTSISVDRAPDGVSIKTPNPGQTTNRP